MRWISSLLRSRLAVGGLLICPCLLHVARAEDRLVIDLDMGVQLAIERNERLLMARADLEKAREQIREARSDALPQVDLSVDYTRNWRLPSFVFGGQVIKTGTDNNISGVVSMRQTLYAGGKVGAALASARHFRGYSEELARSVKQQVIEQAETAFYGLLLARELVRVSELALVQARASLHQAQALRRAGRVSDYDLLRAEVQVASLKSDSIRVGNGAELAEMVFKDIIGLELERKISVSGDFREETALAVEDLDALLRMGIAARPEMAQLDRQLQMRERAVQVEKSGSRPSIDLVASGQTQFQSDKFDVADQEWRKNWRTGVVVNFPLFDGLRTGARVSQARVELRRTGLEKEQLERGIRLDVTRAWLDLQEARERLQAQLAALTQAEKGLQVAESRYASGAGTQLEILDAQLTLTRTRTEWATARHDRALALTRLERAVGVLGEYAGGEEAGR